MWEGVRKLAAPWPSQEPSGDEWVRGGFCRGAWTSVGLTDLGWEEERGVVRTNSGALAGEGEGRGCPTIWRRGSSVRR